VVRSIGVAPSFGYFCVKASVGLARAQAASSSLPSMEGAWSVRVAARCGGAVLRTRRSEEERDHERSLKVGSLARAARSQDTEPLACPCIAVV
jgi:hypothetical protein